MGIPGLLPLLKSIMNSIHIKELEGCFVAVDTYSWLHKGALSCSTELCKGIPTSRHIEYCMHRVNMLRHYGVKPILVFDGGPLPMKNEQEEKRARSRKENLSRAMEHESNGNLSGAYECYQKAVDITPSIAYDLIQVLKQENVSYVVAPYEADAQMAFLAINKQVEAVITEDSDLIPFGCPRIIYKMDKFGQGVEFKNALLQHNKEFNLFGFTQMMMLEMCILSGCDYLQSLPGMGLKKAHTLIKKFKSHDKVIRHLRYSGIEVSPLYEEHFKKAILTFCHQRVYDPAIEDIVHLSRPMDVIGEDLDFLGPSLPQYIARGVARGELNPFTKVPIQGESDANGKMLQENCYQFNNRMPSGAKKKIDLPAQKNLLTNYFCFASIEAKSEFRAPRVTTELHDSNKVISQSADVHKLKHSPNADTLEVLEPQDHGQCISRRDTSYTKKRPQSILTSSICKPCISLHRVLDSDQYNGKSTFIKENGIVQSSYFLKQSKQNRTEIITDVDKNSDSKLEIVVPDQELISDSLERASRKADKGVALHSRSFQQHVKENTMCDTEPEVRAEPLASYRINGSECSVSQTAFGNRKHQTCSSYIEEVSDSDNDMDTESGHLDNKGHIALEFDNDDILQRPCSDNSLERTTKKIKIVQADSLRDGENMDNYTSDLCSSDLEEDTKAQEGKFGCNISHLERYTDISGKCFVSLLSSFRYNSSGSRASGLRPPLKDIKNNCTKRNSNMYPPSTKSCPEVAKRKFDYLTQILAGTQQCPDLHECSEDAQTSLDCQGFRQKSHICFMCGNRTFIDKYSTNCSL